jgi:hypothetical protein
VSQETRPWTRVSLQFERAFPTVYQAPLDLHSLHSQALPIIAFSRHSAQNRRFPRSRNPEDHHCPLLSAATVAFSPLVGVAAVGARLTPYPCLTWGQYGTAHGQPPVSPIDWNHRAISILFLHWRGCRYPSGVEAEKCRDKFGEIASETNIIALQSPRSLHDSLLGC